MNLTQQTAELLECAVFVWNEAECLDARRYDDWLQLWADDGLYILPIDPNTEAYASTLNYIYDDAEMRAARVKRLQSPYSMSATSAARTARTVSRFTLGTVSETSISVRCAQHLVEHKGDVQRTYAADTTYDLQRSEKGFRIKRKIVRLINSTDALGGIAYLL